MSLVDKIKVIYPQLSHFDFTGDINCTDDGDGPYISKWEHATLTQPTQKELDAVKQSDIDDYYKSIEERKWRDAELAKADVELFKVQDNRGTGNVEDWRDYRNALRDYPQEKDFPNGKRPKIKLS